MQAKENKLFKMVVIVMYDYYFGILKDNTDEMITDLKNHKIYNGDSTVDYNNILERYLDQIEGGEFKIKREFAKDLLIDFWLDISPEYLQQINTEMADN